MYVHLYNLQSVTAAEEEEEEEGEGQDEEEDSGNPQAIANSILYILLLYL